MTNNPLVDLSVQQLKRAVEIRAQIEALEHELNRVLDLPQEAEPPAIGKRRGKKTMSAEVRARIAATQRAR